VLPEVEGDLTAEHFNKSIEDLELSVRSFNCLKNANIQTIGDLVVRTENDMMRVKNFGRKSLLEISDILQSMGLEFGMLQDERGRLVPRQSSDG
jgi:DNA-directed RNA polymerase subunit alpha